MLIIGGNGESFDAFERFEREGLSTWHSVIDGPFSAPPVRKARADGPFGEPPVREARAGALGGSTFWMVGGERLAFTPKAPANIVARSDFEGNFGATSGGDDGDPSV